jgi:MFS family permease
MTDQTADTSTVSHRLSVDFRKFWAGQTISNLGSSFTAFALPLLVFKLTGSALNLALTSALYFLPYLLFGLLIGAWVDRTDRKRLMIVTDIARALVIASIPLLSAFGLLSIWWIYAMQFIGATLTICFDSAQFASVPSLVKPDDLVTANGRIQASFSLGNVVGPLLGSVLVTLWPVEQILLFDAFSFLVSAGSLTIIQTAFNVVDENKTASIRQDVIEGLRYVFHHPVLRNISLMMALINLVDSTVYAQLVLFAKQHLQVSSDSQVGVLFSAGGTGVIIFALLAGPIRQRWPFSRVALGSLMVAGMLIVALALIPWYWGALVLWALIAGLGVMFNINTSSLRQAIVPNHMLGRVMTIASVVAWSAIPVGTLIGGFAIERTQNVALVYGVIGVLNFLIAFAFAFTALGVAERYLPREQVAVESIAVGQLLHDVLTE